MSFYADLHIHSKYSRACSKDADLEHLAWWARRKGLNVVGTGDFTHPAWFDHLCETLVPAEPGLFQLRPELAKEVDRQLPPACRRPVRFMLSVEIATIYKRGEHTRKVHHLIYVPDFATARAVTRELAKVGNLASDGRPILGLDSRDLLEITLASGPGAYLVPAHIWTPWFSALGSKSGFDTVADCYADLADHIFAVETGLSSDPPMNHRLGSLDGYRLVSNSDAHSPPMLGREATAFGSATAHHDEINFFAIRDMLRTGQGQVETIEFFPEEGKYHLDGHRKCGLRLHPAETRACPDHRCPSCGKPLTVGVLHRVEALADRPANFRPHDADGFCNLIPLPEIVSEIRGVGPKSKAVQGEVAALVAELGPELTVLRDSPVDEVARAGSPLLAEAISRLRHGEVVRQGGFDGEYGVIRLFDEGELRRRTTAPVLFDVGHDAADTRAEQQERAEQAERPQPAAASTAGAPMPGPQPAAGPPPAGSGVSPPALRTDGSLLDGLDLQQRAAAAYTDGPLLIVAGPGTGKTRTLTFRIAHLITECGVPPENCLAITFTRRARTELRERLAALAGSKAGGVEVTTFHGLGLAILREHHERAGLAPDFRIADGSDRLAVAEEITGSSRDARRLLSDLEAATERANAEERARFEKALRARNLVDLDDLIGIPVRLLSDHPELAAAYRDRYSWICVDEYQDVDARQYALLRHLSLPDGTLCAIGDPDQAIYGFRGADVGFFLRFREDYPRAGIVELSRNYRSTPPILAAATAAIRPAALVPGRELHAADPSTHLPPPRVGLHAAADEDAEAKNVAVTIDRLLGGSSFHSFDTGRVDSDGTAGLTFADIAVLYRTESASRPVTEALTRAGVPFQKRSHDRLASRPGVQDVVRELRHTGELALRRAAEAAIALLPPADAERAADIRTAAELLTPLAEHCEGDLSQFLGELSLGAEVDTWNPRADRVSLLTMHAAKGLEWPVVFLVGCEDGLLPLRWPGDPRACDVDEERRLFFVAITRARSQLFLSHAASRSRHGSVHTCTPSPFLSAIDDGLLHRTGGEAARKRRDRQLRLL